MPALTPLAALWARLPQPVPAHLLNTFWAAFLLTPLIYSLGAIRYTAPRKRAWIATTAASGCMTLAAIPFFIDYLRSGGSVHQLQPRPWLSERVCAGFMGYLISDLLTGTLFYREHLSLLMGWIHHTLYFLLLSLVLTQRWAHIFALAAIMELPTHHLGLATLEPALRNDHLFAALFFVLRVAFHALLIAQLCTPAVRLGMLGGKPGLGQWGPALFTALALPMHVVWFWGCVKGILRRAKQKKQAAAAAAAAAREKAGAEAGAAAVAAGSEPAEVEQEKEKERARLAEQTPGAEKLLAFPPAAARAVGLPTPGLTPHSSPGLRPLGAPPTTSSLHTTTSSSSSSSGGAPARSARSGADSHPTPPLTPPHSTAASPPPTTTSFSTALERAPSLLSLPTLYLPSRDEVRRRLGKEGRREAVRSLRGVAEVGRGVVRRVAGYTGAAAGAGKGNGSEAPQGEGREGQGVERSESPRSAIAAY